MSRLRLLPRVVRWREPDVPSEGNAEGARGAVADFLCDLGDGDFLASQEVLCRFGGLSSRG